jgi:hypothetical protein
LCILIDDGCDAIDFLLKDLSNLPNCQQTQEQNAVCKTSDPKAYAAFWNPIKCEVGKAYAESHRDGPHPDLISCTIIEIVDRAYVQHLSPMIGCLGMNKLNKNGSPNATHCEWAVRIRGVALTQIQQEMHAAYSGDGVDNATHATVDQLHNKLMWYAHKIRVSGNFSNTLVPLIKSKIPWRLGRPFE